LLMLEKNGIWLLLKGLEISIQQMQQNLHKMLLIKAMEN